jgi:hypothetical protein
MLQAVQVLLDPFPLIAFFDCHTSSSLEKGAIVAAPLVCSSNVLQLSLAVSFWCAMRVLFFTLRSFCAGWCLRLYCNIVISIWGSGSNLPTHMTASSFIMQGDWMSFPCFNMNHTSPMFTPKRTIFGNKPKMLLSIVFSSFLLFLWLMPAPTTQSVRRACEAEPGRHTAP